MDSWKIVFGSKVTDVNLVGKDGKEKRVGVKCQNSDTDTVWKCIKENITKPLSITRSGSRYRTGSYMMDFKLHSEAVAVRDAIRAVLDEYAAYVSGTPENTGGSAGNTGGGTPESDKSGGNNTPTPDEPEGETDFSGIAIVIVIALILYLVLSN